MIGIAKTGSGKTIAFGVPSVVHVLGMFVAGVERLETVELSRLTRGSLLLRQKSLASAHQSCMLRACSHHQFRNADQAPVTAKAAQRGPIVLVLSPTRELAMQTADVYTAIGKDAGISWCVYD
jgi:superfamily II DNA/RNA helicase